MPLTRVPNTSIWYDPENVIGEGSFGTKVCRGKIGEGSDLDTAIKALPRGLLDMKEVTNMMKLKKKNTGENQCLFIAEYLMHEVTNDPPIMPLVYVAMELCSGHLQDYVDSRRSSNPTSFDCGGLTPRTIMHQLTQAVGFLHHHGIIHRDIKPRNCLISQADPEGRKIMKLSDFGLSGLQDSCSARSLVVGSYGWMAPEVALHGDNKNAGMDIFSLGCVFSYIVSDGRHIFGEEDTKVSLDLILIQKNINQKDAKSLRHIRKHFTSDFEESEKTLLHKLLQTMVSTDARKRPSAEDILHFPLFLEKKQLKQFFHDLGNMVDVPKCKECKSKKHHVDTCGHEKNEITPQTDQLLQKLRAIDAAVINGNWYSNLDEVIQNYCLTNFSKKDGNYVSALCRAIRNNMEHFQKYQRNTEVQQLFGGSDLGVIDYYNDKFPDLLYHLYVCYHETTTHGSKLKTWRLAKSYGSYTRLELSRRRNLVDWQSTNENYGDMFLKRSNTVTAPYKTKLNQLIPRGWTA